jgi:hypothetical protein
VFVAQLFRHVVQNEHVGLGALSRAFSNARQPGKQPASGQQCVVTRRDVESQHVSIADYPTTEHLQAQRIEGIGSVHLLHQRCVDGVHHADVAPVLRRSQGEIGGSQRRAQWAQMGCWPSRGQQVQVEVSNRRVSHGLGTQRNSAEVSGAGCRDGP